MNRFLNILQNARDNRWCTSLYCTTCGATEFHSALQQVGDGLADELAGLDLSELEQIPDWDESIRFALNEIQKAEMMNRVLIAWLPQLDRHIRIADMVLFYYVRRGAINAPMSIEVLQLWREKCVELAVRTKDESLVESLICTLGSYRDYQALEAVARDLVARGSRRVTAALRRQGCVV